MSEKWRIAQRKNAEPICSIGHGGTVFEVLMACCDQRLRIQLDASVACPICGREWNPRLALHYFGEDLEAIG